MPVLRIVPLAVFALAAACGPTTATSTASSPPAAKPPAKAAGMVPTPLDGYWRQVSVVCPDGRTPTDPVQELDFGDAALYSVTFVPFETYKDYWGQARFDLEAGTIAFTSEGGNFKPPGLDLNGTVALEGGRLKIGDVWFGDRTPGAPPPSTGCAYLFERFHLV